MSENKTINSQTPFETTDIQAAADLGARSQGAELVVIESSEQLVGLPKAVPALLTRGATPGISSVAPLLEAFRIHPKRKQGTAIIQTLESLVDLTNRHKTDHSAVFVNLDWKKPSMTTVIDYHEAANGGIADYCTHRLHYDFPLSEEWKIWLEKDGKFIEQEEFAYFLEDRIPDLASPSEIDIVNFQRDFSCTVAVPSQLVELSRKMHVNVESKVKVNHTLQSGERQLQWEESHVGADGKPITVPGMFILSIPPFFMGEKVRIPVRLRYRVSGGSVHWAYQIYRPDVIITDHLMHSVAEINEKTALPCFAGKPESAQ